MNIAIVGSGITGLAAGWMLARAGHQISLFEKHDHLGMDAHSVTLSDAFYSIVPTGHSIVPTGQSTVPTGLDAARVDVPPRLFNRQLWPNVVRLYESAGIETCPIDPTKTFSDGKGESYLARLHGYRPTVAQLLRTEIRVIAADANRLLNAARNWARSNDWPDLELEEFWKQENYSSEFIYKFLYPALSSTVCTCDFPTLDRYPVQIIFSALLAMVDGDPLQRTRWGSQDVVSRLSQPIQNVHLSTHVSRAYVDTALGKVCLMLNEQPQYFDHLIVATQANHVAKIVSDLQPAEQQLLESFQYIVAPVIVHTDAGQMPDKKENWGHFNMQTSQELKQLNSDFNASQLRKSTTHQTSRSQSGFPVAAQCTMWMNRFRDDWDSSHPNLFQTIMPIVEPESESILARGNLQRPAVTRDSFALWQQLGELLNQPERRIWFCGSYAAEGVPLLESGVASARAVIDRICNRTRLPM